MMLAAAKGASITVDAEGEDEEAALAAVAALIEDKFGEEE
jgi:phosphocarrier protein